MPYDQRLPSVGGDDGSWGNILNQFIEKEHYNTGTNNAANGGHKTITIQASTGSSGATPGAPLKFTSGTLLTSPEAGALEFLTDNLYFTVTTGAVRNTVSLYVQASVASGSTPAGDSRQNEYYVTALSGGPVNFAAPTGTPANGNLLLIRIKDNGSAQTLTFDTIYRGITQALPTTTTVGKTMYLGFKYNSADSKWDLIAYAEGP